MTNLNDPASRPELAEIIQDLVDANHILYDKNVVDGYGHISVRDPRNPDRFLMSRALAPGRVGAGDIMEFDLEGAAIDLRGRSIYGERFIHSEIYKARADINSIVHSHSYSLIPFSITQVELRPVNHYTAFLYKGVPVFEIRDADGMTNMLISNRERGKALADILGNKPVALMRGHGNVVVGTDIRRSTYRAVMTEIGARIQCQAIALGGPITYMAPEEGEIIEKTEHDPRRGRGSEYGMDRVWGMWKTDLDRKG